jgi:hypothetical protein
MPLNLSARFLKPRARHTAITITGDATSAHRVIEDAGLAWEQTVYDGTGESTLRIQDFHCPHCGKVTSVCSRY